MEASPAPNSAGGTLYVFACVSETEELKRENDINREPRLPPINVRISMPDANTLEIIARIGGDVTYNLTKQASDTDAALRSWLDR